MEKILAYNGTELGYIASAWRLINSEGKIIEDNICMKKLYERNEDSAVISVFSADSSAPINGIRVYIALGKHTYFIIDKLQTKERLNVYSDFILKNRDLKTWCNIADKHRITVRNENAGFKHFRLMSEMDGQDIMNTSGLLLPSEVYENGDIVYTMYEGLYNFGEHHDMLYGFAASDPVDIKTWHFVQNETGYLVEPPDKIGGWCFSYDGKSAKMYDSLSPQKKICINMDDYIV